MEVEHNHIVNNCTVPACEQNPTSRSLAKVIKLALATNAINAVVALIVALKTNNVAVVGDFIHTTADLGAHMGHIDTHNKEKDHAREQSHSSKLKVKKIRRITASLIMLGAAYSGTQTVVNYNSQSGQESIDYLALASESAAALAYGGLYFAVKRRNDGSLAYSDTSMHQLVDCGVSTAAAVSVGFGKEYIGAGVATVASMALAYSIAFGKDHENGED